MELAELVQKLTGTGSVIEYRQIPEDDPSRRCPDISLAKKLLEGWEPGIQLEDGLKKTINYFTKIL